ncbi:hypothetical protein BVRB_3g059700 [Beta vulgaris subsp. vulgaris]|uniref:Uncharacterized protein n=1 Tax=Beta vulgaris subsp. vulgaris TaxID=3555 RepID=A0A0J8CPJ8_BETVV|nr:hypothetical protein BVRB_3g059700 [Beta vulgaris subsp. vulgaris]
MSAKEELPMADDLAMVTYTGPSGPPATDQPIIDLDAALDGSAFSGPMAKLVGQMPEAYRTASRSSGESYYSNVVRTLRVGGRPMSPSNRQTIVIPVRNTNESPLSDKGKGKADEAPTGSPTLSDDESSAAFSKMSSTDREKIKLELFKCFPETYTKGLRGASSGHVGCMSQLAVELRKENKKLVADVTKAADHAQYSMAEQELLHQQSKTAWEKRSAEMEVQIKNYLLRLTSLLDEKDAIRQERDVALVAAAELRIENRYLRGKSHMLKLELSATEEAAKEAMNEVINTSKAWAV